MIRGSVSSGSRRNLTPTVKRCARTALLVAWLLACPLVKGRAQSPTLAPPSPSSVETTAPAPNAKPVSEITPLADAPADTHSLRVIPPGSNAPPDSVATPTRPSRPSEDLSVALERRGDLNLHGLTLNAALFTISEQWNVNIVAGDIEGTVNGVFKQAPLKEILDSILLSNGYNYRIVGKSLVVSKIADLGQINPFFQSATIKVNSADIDEVVEGARLLNTPNGQVRALKSVRSIVVLDFPDRVNMIRQFVLTLDGATTGGFAAPGGRVGMPLEVAHYRTQYITALAAQQALQQAVVLSKDGNIGVLEKEDRLLVKDYPENLAMVEKVLERIDRPRPQVRITALIYDISLQDIEDLGLSFNKIGFSSGGESIDIATSASPFKSLTITDGAISSLEGGLGNVGIGTLATHFDINAVCHALQQANDARLLADPNVAVLDNEQAIFKSTREIPIQQLTETQQGGNIGTTAFKEAGITLTVIPKVASDGTIGMEVSPEFSRHVGFDPAGQPIFDKRQATTSLRVANRQTVVIGGLRQREDIGEFNGIPYLKDLKYVGRLFRSRTTNVRESELVVFLMPEIISYADEPNDRQRMVEDTINCRLNQIPEAEGCPPCCRRLPPGVIIEETDAPAPDDAQPIPPPADNTSPDAFPTIQQPDDLPPLSAANIPSAEFQFGPAGRAEHVRALVADGRLRRLPTVAEPNDLPAEAENNQVEIAGRLQDAPLYR